ncbi:MAG: septation protein A [Parasphingorhabdus sp.]|nr:septation protein A [Parasphingorhabdus sp.]
MSEELPAASPAKGEGQGLKTALDFGPLLVFFVANWLAPEPQIFKVLVATAAFMVAMVIAMIVSWVKLKKIAPMLWVSAVLVLVFGGATLYFRSETFIQVKPTIVYLIFATILGFGILTERPFLKMLMGASYPGVTNEGYRKLTISWTLFFVAAAAVNEIVWRTQSWDFWVGFKLWGMIPATILFALANIPMLMKHGLMLEEPDQSKS